MGNVCSRCQAPRNATRWTRWVSTLDTPTDNQQQATTVCDNCVRNITMSCTSKNSTMTRHVLLAFAIVGAATRAMAQYQPPDINLDPTVTAHCAWGDADCAAPIIHGAATPCHQDQARCEGQCARLEAGATTTWCEGAPYPTPSTPGGDPTAPGCTWHDVDDLQQMSTCVGNPQEMMQCRQQLVQDLHPTCTSCLQANDHNVSACVLDSSPHCLVHDAHDVSSSQSTTKRACVRCC